MPAVRCVRRGNDFSSLVRERSRFDRQTFVAIFPFVNENLTIKINGEARQISRGSSLLDLLEELDLDPRYVVVELNRTIVRRSALTDTSMNDGDEVELVHFVGGG